MASTTLMLAGLDIELFETGDGPPLLFLHGDQGFAAGAPFVDGLAKRRRVLCPSHPGFGRSALADWIDDVDDISYLYLELLDRKKVQSADIVGCGVGGWIAAELATKAPDRVRKLVLVGPVGVKVGPKDRLDVPDIHLMSATDLERAMFHDPETMRTDLKALSDDELKIIFRNRETLTLLTWEPYMHNPKLRHRLHRVSAPTLFMRGASDGLVSADYLEKYAGLVPGSRIVTLPRAGHAPELEHPEAFVAAVLSFLDT